MTDFFENIRDQVHYVRSILSDVKTMKTLMAEQQLQHAVATTCELCHGQFTKKNKKTKHHYHLCRLYISPYCNTCNLKLKYKKDPNSDPTAEMKKLVKRKQTKFFNGTYKKFIKKAVDIAKERRHHIISDVIFHKLKGYDSHLVMQYITPSRMLPARSMSYQPFHRNL